MVTRKLLLVLLLLGVLCVSLTRFLSSGDGRPEAEAATAEARHERHLLDTEQLRQQEASHVTEAERVLEDAKLYRRRHERASSPSAHLAASLASSATTGGLTYDEAKDLQHPPTLFAHGLPFRWVLDFGIQSGGRFLVRATYETGFTVVLEDLFGNIAFEVQVNSATNEVTCFERFTSSSTASSAPFPFSRGQMFDLEVKLTETTATLIVNEVELVTHPYKSQNLTLPFISEVRIACAGADSGSGSDSGSDSGSGSSSGSDCLEIYQVEGRGLLRSMQPRSSHLDALLNFQRPFFIRGAIVPRIHLGIWSKPERLDQRMAMRRSWLSGAQFAQGKITYMFVIPGSTDPLDNLILEREALRFSDISILPVEKGQTPRRRFDLYLSVTLHAHTAPYYGFITDDVYIHDDHLLSAEFLKTIGGRNFAAEFDFGLEASVDKNDPLYCGEYCKDNVIPPLPKTDIFVVSSWPLQYMWQEIQRETSVEVDNNRLAIAVWMDTLNSQGHSVVLTHFPDMRLSSCSPSSIIVSGASPYQIVCMWAKKMHGDKDFCCK